MGNLKRNRKIRRRLRMTLNHGHEVRHKLRSGRTGKVHSVKMRSPAKSKPTGEIELLIPPVRFEKKIAEPQILIEASAPIPRVRRRRPIIIDAPQLPEIMQPEIVTHVDAIAEAYGYVLRAIQTLSIRGELTNPKEINFLNALLKIIDQYERK